MHCNFAFGLAAVAGVMAMPQPMVTPEPDAAVVARQVGGGLGGSVPGASGTIFGSVPASGLPYGCIGGVADGTSTLICARDAMATPAPVLKAEARQIGGGLGGSVPGASGSVFGTIPASGLPYGCVGGVADGTSTLICARDAMATPAPVLKAEARQVGGGLGGSVPGFSGTLSGFVPASGVPFGCVGGSADGTSTLICAREAMPTPFPEAANL